MLTVYRRCKVSILGEKYVHFKHSIYLTQKSICTSDCRIQLIYKKKKEKLQKVQSLKITKVVKY